MYEVLRQLIFFAALGLIAWLIWLFSRWKNQRYGVLPPDRSDIPYRAYTKAFDIVVAGRDVETVISPTEHIPAGMKILSHGDRIGAAETVFHDAKASDGRQLLTGCLDGLTNRAAVVLLIDQSGSMVDRIVTIAGQVLLLAEEFEREGVELAVLGFTTTSWRGGEPRLQWIKSGKPNYPGRLCALLHIIYRGFEALINRSDWEAMLNPKALRENIDGEAIQWAVDLLRSRKEPDKRLIVISDGAPVDDSTYSANGDRLLQRHLEAVAGELQDADDLQVGSISIDYDQPVWNSRELIDDPAEFLVAFVRLMTGMSDAVHEKSTRKS